MQPCLMCFSSCYWAGIRKVIYAISKLKVGQHYYEGSKSVDEINNQSHQKIELVHLKEYEEEVSRVGMIISLLSHERLHQGKLMLYLRQAGIEIPG
jgi:tRNA(Arg) A34 adenosine deaminase TadA